jgi:hypothetical protein
MTIAIGLISQKLGPDPAILMACDSQLTRETTKRLDSRKIRIIEFSNAQVLVAQAGSDALSNKAIDIFAKKAKDRPLLEEETPVKLLEESVREVRKHLIDVNQGCNFSDDGWRRYFKEHNFELMLGYCFNRIPCLYTIDIDWCLPTAIRTSYVAIGVGRDLGEFLIREYSQSDPEFKYAWVTSVSVVEKVIDNVNGCDRPTWVGIVYALPEDHILQKRMVNQPYPESHALIIDQVEIKLIIEELRAEEARMKPTRVDQMIGILQRVGEKRARLHLQQLEEEDSFDNDVDD